MTDSLESTICLFDVDGTLTPSRNPATQEMLQYLNELKGKVALAWVSGSDLVKISDQLDGRENTISLFKYCFAENGLVAFKEGNLISKQDIVKHMGDKNVKEFVNFCLKYIADIDIPKKRGTFIELRTGLINLCPVGRNCSQEEREEFSDFDMEHKVREKFVEVLKKEFAHMKLRFVIGGQISIDVFPEGWDKTFCLNILEKEGVKTIHFFGDRAYPGGNDYEAYMDDRTIGHKVKNPDETIQLLKQLFP
ncbi:Phosphomannomutase-like [Oopsacas minuta]|uniref:Phosphomannomutase n=1 Tax=Oopsacas minuta TaxID=111878 RepID=A0AAV7JU39_9METZ|nr:Phosphomannomutase-like [Oopsacas minuta]